MGLQTIYNDLTVVGNISATGSIFGTGIGGGTNNSFVDSVVSSSSANWNLAYDASIPSVIAQPFYTSGEYNIQAYRRQLLYVSTPSIFAQGILVLPRQVTDLAQSGDEVELIITSGMSNQNLITVQQYLYTGSLPYLPAKITLLTIKKPGRFRLRLDNFVWSVIPVQPHASNHSTGGNDEIIPSDINARTNFTYEQIAFSSQNITLTASRAKYITTINFEGATRNLTLPSTENIAGDTFIFKRGSGNANVDIYGLQGGSLNLLGSLQTNFNGTLRYEFYWSGDAWLPALTNTHTHDASDIVSGTLGIYAPSNLYSNLSGNWQTAYNVATSYQVASGSFIKTTTTPSPGISAINTIIAVSALPVVQQTGVLYIVI